MTTRKRTNKNETNNKVILSQQEVETIKSNISSLEDMARAEKEVREDKFTAAELESITINKDKIKKEIAKLKTQLENYAPKRESDPVKRDKIKKMREELERRFTPYLETFTELNVVRRTDPNWMPAYQKALRRHEVEHLIRKWRELGLMLEPDDPTINDLDRLRKAR